MIPVEMNDTEFAAHLTKHKAVDNSTQVGKSVQWFAPDGACVAITIYDNEESTRRLFIAT